MNIMIITNINVCIVCNINIIEKFIKKNFIHIHVLKKYLNV